MDMNSKDAVSGQGEYNLAYHQNEKDINPENDQKSETKMSEAEKRQMRFAIMKNVLGISIAFVFLFTSYNGVSNLQSSINKKLGTTSLWVTYAALVFSCYFLPSLVVKKLKTKWTLPASMICYSLYIAAQFYPTYYTFVPTSFLLGMAAAPLWISKCSYITQVGEIYGKLVGENSEISITRFFGIFFFFFQTTNVWGNLISSTVLSSGVDSITRTDEFLDHCGSNYCPWFAENLTINAGNAEKQDAQKEDLKRKIYIMTSIYLVCSLMSVLIVSVFVDPLSRFGIDEDETNNKPTKKLVIATFTQMGKIKQILIIPLTIWSGLEQAFISADYTAGFISCGLGIHMVGYVLICFGAADAISSICFSSLVKKFGRVPIFTFGASLNAILIVVMRYWRPNPDQIAVFFILIGLWGVSDAIWQTQINAFYGVIFPRESEAAFSNYRLWESIGFLIAYICSGILCIELKIYILVVFLVLGMVGYYLIEFIQKRGGLTRNGKNIVTVGDLLKLR